MPTSTADASGVRHHRARVAALTRSRAADDPELLSARRDLKTERLAEYIQRTVDAAPPLTAAQRDRLALLLLSPHPVPAEVAIGRTGGGQ